MKNRDARDLSSRRLKTRTQFLLTHPKAAEHRRTPKRGARAPPKAFGGAFWSAVLLRRFLSELRSSRFPRGVGDGRACLVPVCALLVSMRDLENARFIERFA
jgi:hypothetical protein